MPEIFQPSGSVAEELTIPIHDLDHVGRRVPRTPRPWTTRYVAGIVSGPLGIFRGNTNGPDRGLTQPRFSLVLLACGRFLSTSARRIDCQVLAEELAPLEVVWSATDPYAVTGPGIETARWLLQCCQRRYEL